MNIIEINNMINIIKKHKLNDLKLNDNLIESRINMICKFILDLPINYIKELNFLDNSNIRFCDYYDGELYHGTNIIKYFEDNYNGQNKESSTELFAIYVILLKAQEIVYNYEICDSPEELYELLDCDHYFEDIISIIQFLQQKKIEQTNIEDDNLEFLNEDCKYKILFTGKTYEDFNKLEKHIKKAFIHKISKELSTSEHITLTESIDHVKEKYGFPIFRIQFADDYRIAFIRKNNVTAILGINIKTNKDRDYSRYDSIAEKKDFIYKEIELFSNDLLPENSEHYKTLDCIKEFYKKNMSTSTSKTKK